MFAPTVATESSVAPRVLVIGLDGATFDVLRPLADAGLLPHLSQLMRRAAHSVALESTRPTLTPVAWSSLLTGAMPQSHGVLDYRYLDHQRGSLQLNHAGRLRCPTLLDAVSHGLGPVVALNLPMTYPAGASVRGIVVGGIDSPSVEAAMAPYPEFAQRLRNHTRDYSLRTVWKRPPRDLDELRRGVRQTEAIFQSRVIAAELADRQTPWSLMAVQFQTLDSLQHRCWHLLGLPGNRGERYRDWVPVMHQAFRALDICVGRLLELAARRDAAVVVLSDHGFGPFRQRIGICEWLRRRGLVRSASWSQRAVHRWGRFQHQRRKHDLRRTQQGGSTAGLQRPWNSQFAADGRRSMALAAHGAIAGLVYLNTSERFERGQLKTPRQTDQAAADTMAALIEARHPETHERLFDEVFLPRERFGIDPLDWQWPEVVAIPAAGFHVHHRLGRDRLLEEDPMMQGTHRREGILMIDAPIPKAAENRASTENPKSAARSAHVCDVAPTILQLLGLRPPAHMTGRGLIAPAESIVEPIGQSNVGPNVKTNCEPVAASIGEPMEQSIEVPIAVTPREALPVNRISGSKMQLASELTSSQNSASQNERLGPVLDATQQSVVEQRLRELGYLE